MRRLALAALLCAGCAQQDAALLVTLSGAFNVPQNADELHLEVYDGGAQIKQSKWCFTATADCPALPAQVAFSGTVTLVQSGGSHPHVKINAELYKGGVVVGLGTVTADFSSGSTVQVALPLTPPQ